MPCLSITSVHMDWVVVFTSLQDMLVQIGNFNGENKLVKRLKLKCVLMGVELTN